MALVLINILGQGYMHQVQTLMRITGLKQYIIIVYTKVDLISLIIHFNDTEWNLLMKNVKLFFRDHYQNPARSASTFAVVKRFIAVSVLAESNGFKQDDNAERYCQHFLVSVGFNY